MFKKKVMLLLLWIFFFSGCSQLKLNTHKNISTTKKVDLLCEEEAPSKSLQELEKKYRCQGE